MSQEEFDNHDLIIDLQFPEGYGSQNFFQDVSENIAQYTTGMVYDLEIVPKEE